MPKINATLPEKMIDEIKFISMKHGKSFSTSTKNLIEIGLKYHGNHKEHLPLMRQEEVLLSILNLVMETYAMVFDAKKINNEFNNPNDAIAFVKESIKQNLMKKYDEKER